MSNKTATRPEVSCKNTIIALKITTLASDIGIGKNTVIATTRPGQTVVNYATTDNYRKHWQNFAVFHWQNRSRYQRADYNQSGRSFRYAGRRHKQPFRDDVIADSFGIVLPTVVIGNVTTQRILFIAGILKRRIACLWSPERPFGETQSFSPLQSTAG
ncbi:MAG: hypothetical protein OEV63_11190 [Gammaproteobacteria bacterium]|nr:hypothetical protein [Gammaproteobacteria bacterium]MDH5214910.1 hypothetical protein [Gammaproteobacteria bacterium]